MLISAPASPQWTPRASQSKGKGPAPDGIPLLVGYRQPGEVRSEPAEVIWDSNSVAEECRWRKGVKEDGYPAWGEHRASVWRGLACLR